MGTLTFALHQLGWADFQSLCHTVTREVLGQTVVAYLDNDDGGRDGAFSGRWVPHGLEMFEGEFVVQAKHTAIENSTLGASDFADEFDKAERLAAAGRCDVYVLMTNARLTARTEEKLTAELRRRGVRQSLILSSTWINQTIIERPRLRMLVPRLYGLGDLTQILDERAYVQAQAVLDSMRTDLAKLVRTTTYEDAAAALDAFGFVLLVGAAATGKTTIAGQLSLAAADVFDTHVVTLDDASQFADRWNPNEKQLFWLDDAFGATQFSPFLATSWQRATPKINAAIAGGSKFVLTSRDYIVRSAWSRLKPGSFPLLDGARVVVDVTVLTPSERRQILYNHLKHGRQPTSTVEKFLPHLEEVTAHPGYTPELARRLADPTFTRSLRYPSQGNLMDFFGKPHEFLADTLDGLGEDSIAALGLIFLNQGWLPSPIKLGKTHEDLLSRLGGDLAAVTRSLGEMDGSLVSNVVRDGDRGWVFAHPTMIDAYADRLRGPELLHLLVEGFGVGVLLAQTTCGDVGYKNAIVLPAQLWPKVLDRLDEPPTVLTESERHHDQTQSYLANRCVPEFQQAYLDRHPGLLESLSEPGLAIEGVADNAFVATLHASGVLPEPIRAVFVGHLIRHCISGEDGAVLWAREFRAMLTSAEESVLRHRLMTEVVADPTRVLDQCVGWSSSLRDEDPDQFTATVVEFADAIESEFGADERAIHAAAVLRAAREDWIADQEVKERPPAVNQDSYSSKSSDAPIQGGSRSVFDDLLTPQKDG